MDYLNSVSIIVPAYNAEKNISKLLESLLNQDYPKEQLEIIIVDNNSDDKTKRIVEQYPVKIFDEKNIQSSYAARNLGIRNSKNDILVFTDADCCVDSHWIKNGVKCLNSEDADLVAGNVIFNKKSKFNLIEIYDSNMYLQQEYNASIGTSTTANLFIRRNVFDSLGLFPVVSSGGDVRWVKLASNNGFKITYCKNAKVFHSARRNLEEIIKKEIRLCESAGIISSLVNFHYREIKGKIFSNNKRENLKKVGLFIMVLYIKNTFKIISAFALSIKCLRKKIEGKI